MIFLQFCITLKKSTVKKMLIKINNPADQTKFYYES